MDIKRLRGYIIPNVLATLGVSLYILADTYFISASAGANGLTALYGFPPDAIITESTCRALGKTEDEFKYLMLKMFPSMIVGGFTTVTITSVFVAGIFAGFLG